MYMYVCVLKFEKFCNQIITSKLLLAIQLGKTQMGVTSFNGDIEHTYYVFQLIIACHLSV